MWLQFLISVLFYETNITLTKPGFVDWTMQYYKMGFICIVLKAIRRQYISALWLHEEHLDLG